MTPGCWIFTATSRKCPPQSEVALLSPPSECLVCLDVSNDRAGRTTDLLPSDTDHTGWVARPVLGPCFGVFHRFCPILAAPMTRVQAPQLIQEIWGVTASPDSGFGRRNKGASRCESGIKGRGPTKWLLHDHLVCYKDEPLEVQ